MHKISENRIKELLLFSVPDLCDVAGTERAMEWRIKPMAAMKKIAGPAFTVLAPTEDNAVVAEALKYVKEGEVIVVEGKKDGTLAYWGDHRSNCAKLINAEAVIIDGLFRDVEDCEKIGFPVYAKGLTTGASAVTGEGKMNVTIQCGGVTVNPGDIIVGDRNGVIVLVPEQVEEVLEKARKRKEDEKWTIEQMYHTGEILPRVIKRQ